MAERFSGDSDELHIAMLHCVAYAEAPTDSVSKRDGTGGIEIEEQTEDMQLMVGLDGEERTLTPWTTSFKRRLPWLCINLLTACMAGAVVGLYGMTIDKFVILAVFLPIIASQGGNAGSH